MGCIRSKPIHYHDESNELKQSCDESHSPGFEQGLVNESKSYESISDVGCLHEKLVIGDDDVATDLGTGRDTLSDNIEEKSSENDVLERRMQVIRDVVERQMTELRMARDRVHWCIIKRDATNVVQALKKSQSFYDKESEDILSHGEIPLTDDDDVVKLQETKSKGESSAKEAAIWLLDVVLDQINYENEKFAGKDEEDFELDDEDTEMPDFGYFQFRRSNKCRMTIRKASRLQPSSRLNKQNVCCSIGNIDIWKESSTEQNKLPPSAKMDVGGASTSDINIGFEKEKPLSKDIDSSAVNTDDAIASTEVLLPVPEVTAQPISETDIDQPTENENTLSDDHEDINAEDTDLKPSHLNEESSIYEDMERRRLQWLANRNSSIPSVRVQQEMKSDTQPREIDIDSVIARKKFPWMRQGQAGSTKLPTLLHHTEQNLKCMCSSCLVWL